MGGFYLAITKQRLNRIIRTDHKTLKLAITRPSGGKHKYGLEVGEAGHMPVLHLELPLIAWQGALHTQVETVGG